MIASVLQFSQSMGQESYRAIDIAGGKPPFIIVKAVGTSISSPVQIPFNLDVKLFFSSSFPGFPPLLLSGALSAVLSSSGVEVLDSMISGDQLNVKKALKMVMTARTEVAQGFVMQKRRFAIVVHDDDQSFDFDTLNKQHQA